MLTFIQLPAVWVFKKVGFTVIEAAVKPYITSFALAGGSAISRSWLSCGIWHINLFCGMLGDLGGLCCCLGYQHWPLQRPNSRRLLDQGLSEYLCKNMSQCSALVHTLFAVTVINTKWYFFNVLTFWLSLSSFRRSVYLFLGICDRTEAGSTRVVKLMNAPIVPF